MGQVTNGETLSMRVEGMSCQHCVRAVRDALAEVPGVEVRSVEVGAATVAYDPSQTTTAQIADAVRDAGYELADV